MRDRFQFAKGAIIGCGAFELAKRAAAPCCWTAWRVGGALYATASTTPSQSGGPGGGFGGKGMQDGDPAGRELREQMPQASAQAA